jgi:hypothetical protein
LLRRLLRCQPQPTGIPILVISLRKEEPSRAPGAILTAYRGPGLAPAFRSIRRQELSLALLHRLERAGERMALSFASPTLPDSSWVERSASRLTRWVVGVFELYADPPPGPAASTWGPIPSPSSAAILRSRDIWFPAENASWIPAGISAAPQERDFGAQLTSFFPLCYKLKVRFNRCHVCRHTPR